MSETRERTNDSSPKNSKKLKHKSEMDESTTQNEMNIAKKHIIEEPITSDKYSKQLSDHIKIILQRDVAQDTDNAWDRTKNFSKDVSFVVGGSPVPFRFLTKDARSLIKGGIAAEGNDNTCHDFFMLLWHENI